MCLNLKVSLKAPFAWRFFRGMSVYIDHGVRLTDEEVRALDPKNWKLRLVSKDVITRESKVPEGFQVWAFSASATPDFYQLAYMGVLEFGEALVAYKMKSIIWLHIDQTSVKGVMEFDQAVLNLFNKGGCKSVRAAMKFKNVSEADAPNIISAHLPKNVKDWSLLNGPLAERIVASLATSALNGIFDPSVITKVRDCLRDINKETPNAKEKRHVIAHATVRMHVTGLWPAFVAGFPRYDDPYPGIVQSLENKEIATRQLQCLNDLDDKLRSRYPVLFPHPVLFKEVMNVIRQHYFF